MWISEPIKISRNAWALDPVNDGDDGEVDMQASDRLPYGASDPAMLKSILFPRIPLPRCAIVRIKASDWLIETGSVSLDMWMTHRVLEDPRS